MRIRFLLAAITLVAMVYYIGFPPQPGWTGRAISAFQEKDISLPELPKFPSASQDDIAVYFCAVDDCVMPLSNLTNQSNQTDCALYDVTIPGIAEVLASRVKQGTARLVVDDEATKKDARLDFAKRDREGGLMHDKFCVFDHTTVMTGSFNPTAAGARTFDNNMLVIRSPELVTVYETEFAELWDGQFGKGERSAETPIRVGRIELEVSFCPEDWCANEVLRELGKAEHTIDFMLYSFTHDQIGDLLVEKHKAGVTVQGVMEKSQNNAYDEYDKLVATGIDVQWDGNSGLMHHKVFIIDEQTVITGSFNPSKNADTRNDENLLIIRDAAIAARFTEEFRRVSALAT